jgi:hypothetical protein
VWEHLTQQERARIDDDWLNLGDPASYRQHVDDYLLCNRGPRLYSREDATHILTVALDTFPSELGLDYAHTLLYNDHGTAAKVWRYIANGFGPFSLPQQGYKYTEQALVLALMRFVESLAEDYHTNPVLAFLCPGGWRRWVQGEWKTPHNSALKIRNRLHPNNCRVNDTYNFPRIDGSKRKTDDHYPSEIDFRPDP